MRIETEPFGRIRTYYKETDYVKVQRQPKVSIKHASWCHCPRCKGNLHIIRENGVMIYSNCINCGFGVY